MSTIVLFWIVFNGIQCFAGTFARDGCKTMIFKEIYEGKALKNHVFHTTKSRNDRSCRVLCYLDDRCLSYNYGTSTTGEKETCELCESDHVMHNKDLMDRPDTVYLRAENTCNCPKEKTCRFSFVNSSYKCGCKTGFTGSLCNVTIGTFCGKNPCLNGAICTDTDNGYECACPSQFTGVNCGTQIAATPVTAASASTTTISTTQVRTAATSSTSSTTTGDSTTAAADSTTTNQVPTAATSSTSSTTTTTSSPDSTTATADLTTTQAPTAGTSSTSSNSASLSSSSSSTSSASSSSDVPSQNPTTQATTTALTTTAASSSSDCHLDFASASQSNMIKIPNPFSNALQQFTVSFWLKVPSSSVILYPFSYATESVTSAFSISIKDDGVIEIGINGGGKTISSFLKRDNTWQHFAVTWKSNTGNVKLYYNGGARKSSETGLAQDETFPTGGLLIVGQNQGGYDNGFDETKSMKGNLAGLNIWSTEYTSTEVQNVYAQNCYLPAGDVLSWATILAGEFKGSIPKVCPATCHP